MTEDANQLWQRVLTALRGKLNPQMVDKLLQPLEALDAADGVFLMQAPNDFAREWVSRGYVTVIQDTLKHLTGTEWSVHWAASPNAPLVAPRKTAPRQTQSHAPAPSATKSAPAAPVAAKTVTVTPPSNPGAAVGARSAGLSPRYTFDTFVTGPSNQVAHAMALAMANLTGRRASVLFLCGTTGLGKTHLSNAIGHKVLEQKPDARIVYVSAETFTNEYVVAIQQKRMEEFRTRYRVECDALLIDDVQFLAGREGTQEEFFHTFNALFQRGAPIVLTSDVLPQKLLGMAERLMSRFASGLVAEVYPPEVETRVAILRKKAEQDNLRMDDESAFLIASAGGTNVRELEGTLMKLAIKASLLGRTVIDVALVRETLRVGARPSVTTVEDIQKAVCDHYRIKLAQLTGKDRHREVALPRQVAMYLARVHLGTSFPQLGLRFGGKDHTTVISAVRKIDKVRGLDPDVEGALAAVSLKLGRATVPGLGPVVPEEDA